MSAERLRKWMAGRIGYGSLKAKWWFLGMEEACEPSDSELSARLSGDLLEDFLVGHKKLFPRCRDMFEPKVKAQRTLRPLIKTLLAATSRPDSLDDIKAYQAMRWGRLDGETLQTELLPLPSPSKGAWPAYYVKSGLPELLSRKAYESKWIPIRVNFLRQLIAANQPKVLIAYGAKHWPEFEQLVPPESRWEQVPLPGGFSAKYTVVPGARKRIAVMTPHPVARGPSNADWIALGQFITRALMAGS
jgi:hypothetical protein